MADEETMTDDKQRRRARLDVASMTVTPIADGVIGSSYEIGKLPENVYAHCALIGAWFLMRQLGKDDPGAGYAKLLAGELPERREAAGRKVSPWKQSIANALAEATKKSDAPLTPEAALEKVGTFDRARLAQARREPLVVKHYQRLTGATANGGLLNLISAEASNDG